MPRMEDHGRRVSKAFDVTDVFGHKFLLWSTALGLQWEEMAGGRSWPVSGVGLTAVISERKRDEVLERWERGEKRGAEARRMPW